MRNLLLSAFILLSYYSNAQQHIVGTYSDGRTYAVTDTLRDAEVCSFRLSNGERADWKVEISPYNDETVLCSAKDTAALEMKVMPYPRNVWREASLARHREDTTRDCDYVYYKGRVCCSSASGVKDTLNLVFDVLPTRPKLIAMHLSDFEIDQEYPDASECHVAVDVSIQNTKSLLYEILWVLEPREIEWACDFKTDFSNSIDTTTNDLDRLSYVGEGFVINSVNLYGSVATVEYAISDFVEEEPYRQFVDDYIGLGIEEVTEAPVGIRREGNFLVCNSPDVKSMRLLNLQGQIVDRSTGNRLPLPMGNRHSCYIVVIQLNNKTITKKVQL